jgi:hypothetical protein
VIRAGSHSSVIAKRRGFPQLDSGNIFISSCDTSIGASSSSQMLPTPASLQLSIPPFHHHS